MEVKFTIPEYSNQGIQFEWEDDFEIKVGFKDGEVLISANRAGLISLAKQMLTLAQETVPTGYHLHYDEYNSLDVDSLGLIIEKK